MANFWLIFNFSHKKWLRLTWNGQFHPICTFYNFFPPKWLIFLPNLKIFIYRGRGTSANFPRFCNFLNRLQPKWLKMTHNGQFYHQSGSDWLDMANFGQFSTFPIFSHKKQLRLTQNGQFHMIRTFFNLFPPKQLIAKSQNFHFQGGYIGQFSQILKLFESFPNEVAKNDPQWPILPLKWLELAQNGQFWSIFNFSHLFLQKVAQTDSEWPI